MSDAVQAMKIDIIDKNNHLLQPKARILVKADSSAGHESQAAKLKLDVGLQKQMCEPTTSHNKTIAWFLLLGARALLVACDFSWGEAKVFQHSHIALARFMALCASTIDRCQSVSKVNTYLCISANVLLDRRQLCPEEFL